MSTTMLRKTQTNLFMLLNLLNKNVLPLTINEIVEIMGLSKIVLRRLITQQDVSHLFNKSRCRQKGARKGQMQYSLSASGHCYHPHINSVGIPLTIVYDLNPLLMGFYNSTKCREAA